MVDIDSPVPGPLDKWLDSSFSKSSRLKKTTKRAALIIAPLFGDNTGTKQIPRWKLNDHLVDQASREALTSSEEECRHIRNRLLAQVPLMEDAPGMASDVRECVEDIVGQSTGPITCPKTEGEISIDSLEAAMNQTTVLGLDESPIGYKASPVEGGQFGSENVAWLRPPTELYALRDFFDAKEGGSKLLAKAQRKTYKTDRRLTGSYKTNRENRWESHPRDPQAASRWNCLRIERKLLGQIFEFESAPDVPRDLEDTVLDIIEADDFADASFHCPITGSRIDYTEFMDNVRDSDHGRSEYHVGHLDPLAMTAGEHEESNVSWITERGNRVQGEDSLAHTTDIIFDMAEYHTERLGLSWKEAKKWDRNQR